MSDDLPLADGPLHAKQLRREHTRARRRALLQPRRSEVVDDHSPRFATLTLGLFGTDGKPLFIFLLNNSLIDRIEVAAADKGSPLSEIELLEIAVANAEGAVQESFSSDAINALNASYYASPIAFSKHAFLANMYVANITLNYVLGAYMAAETGGKATLRVKELASSTETGHWQFMAEGMRHYGAKHMEIVLTDFVPLTLDPTLANYADLTVSSEVYSLQDELPPLAADKRFDAFFASYAFDSVWQPEDVRLTRVGDNWYQSAYRLKVADWNKRKDELLTALHDRVALPHAKPRDYRGVFVEEVRKKVDLAAHPYGDIIARSARRVVNVPGGAIKRIVNAFETQIAPDGIFVIGDVTHESAEAEPHNSEITGVAARYKVEDYALLQQVLEEKYGFRVDFVDFPDLARRFLPANWRQQVPVDEVGHMRGRHGNGLVVIRRRERGHD